MQSAASAACNSVSSRLQALLLLFYTATVLSDLQTSRRAHQPCTAAHLLSTHQCLHRSLHLPVCSLISAALPCRSPCHVVYTDYRPTPLQHYLFPAGADGLYLVVDEQGEPLTTTGVYIHITCHSLLHVFMHGLLVVEQGVQDALCVLPPAGASRSTCVVCIQAAMPQRALVPLAGAITNTCTLKQPQSRCHSIPSPLHCCCLTCRCLQGGQLSENRGSPDGYGRGR